MSVEASLVGKPGRPATRTPRTYAQMVTQALDRRRRIISAGDDPSRGVINVTHAEYTVILRDGAPPSCNLSHTRLCGLAIHAGSTIPEGI